MLKKLPPLPVLTKSRSALIITPVVCVGSLAVVSCFGEHQQRSTRVSKHKTYIIKLQQ